MPPIRIVTIDDHPIFRDGLRRLLEAEPGLEVVAEGGTGADALRLVEAFAPDILLLDLALPDMSGLDVLRKLEVDFSRVRVVLLTASADKQQGTDALLLGARGLVLKESATSTLYDCIRSVMAGEYWMGQGRLPDVIDALRKLGNRRKPTPAETLTRRELTIISAIVDGSTNRQAAGQLRLSDQTVRNHLSVIYDKLGVSNRLELALYAIHHKLLERLPPTD
jgi:two-component system, NarL family, nitrate/nitrite response regulator NarL